jgi:hypothetical protein
MHVRADEIYERMSLEVARTEALFSSMEDT